MSAYNTLVTLMRCPRCGHDSEVRIDFRFGLINLLEYKIGDRLKWTGRGTKVPALRPDDGNFVGEGYTECGVCGKYFWARIAVEADIITDVGVDWDREEYPCRP